LLKPCCRNLFKIADLFCYLASSANRMARLHTWQSWLKTGLLPIAMNSLVKVNGLRICLTSSLWTTMSAELCLNETSHFNPSRRTSMSSRMFCSWYGTSCHAQDSINKAILSFLKRLRACVKAGDGHFEHMLKWTTCEILKFVITVNVSWQLKLKVAVDYSTHNWKYGIEYLYSHNFGEN